MNQTFSHWAMFVLGAVCATCGWLALAAILAQPAGAGHQSRYKFADRSGR